MPADRVLIMAKSKANRLDFALLLLFYRAKGRFPKAPDEIEPNVVGQVAQQLGMPVTSHDWFDTASRTWKGRTGNSKRIVR